LGHSIAGQYQFERLGARRHLYPTPSVLPAILTLPPMLRAVYGELVPEDLV